MLNPLHEIFVAYTALARLLWQLIPSRLALLGAIGSLLLAGALEASSVAMLVPLLSSLTGKELANDALARTLERLLPDQSAAFTVALLAGLTFAVIALKNVVFYGSVLLSTRLRRDGIGKLRNLLMERVLNAAPEVFERRTTGDLMNVFLTEAARTNQAFDFLIQLTQRSVVALSYLVAILFISWQLTLLTAVLGAGLGVIGVVLSRRLLPRGEALGRSNSALSRKLVEICAGLRLIRTTHSEEREQGSFADLNRRQAEADVAITRAGTLLTTSVETVAVATAMVVTAVAYHWLLLGGELSTPAFLAFGFGLLRLLPALNQVYGLQVVVLGLSAALGPTREWLALPRYPERPFGARRLTELGTITFDDVSFRYPGGPEALRSLSFEVPPGSFLAIVGASGAGKTTLASLLLRLRAPSAGQIRLGAHDYWEFEPESYCRAVAYVEQEPVFFNESVLENVRYGAPEAGRREVEQALALAQMSDVVAALPQGLDTVLAERGASLSGGQRQRLAIARALVRAPKIIIMDEPTSALDADTEREVVAAIERARVGRTLIVIAHRESTIERADSVLKLKDGRVDALLVGAAQ